jgi:hypothetical protein
VPYPDAESTSPQSARHGTQPASGAADPLELVIGFGNLTESTIRWGIAEIGKLLRGEL